MGTPVTDVVMPKLHSLSPQIREILERESRGACAVVASHPYLYPLLAELGLPVWYEAQDFELHMKTRLFEKLPECQELVDAVYAVEKACATGAELILCASPDDADDLVKTYGVERGRIVDTPNGTDALRVAFMQPADRQALKERLGSMTHDASLNTNLSNAKNHIGTQDSTMIIFPLGRNTRYASRTDFSTF